MKYQLEPVKKLVSRSRFKEDCIIYKHKTLPNNISLVVSLKVILTTTRLQILVIMVSWQHQAAHDSCTEQGRAEDSERQRVASPVIQSSSQSWSHDQTQAEERF